jgi:hypothetical protein
MAEEGFKRKLTAILSADVVGYNTAEYTKRNITLLYLFWEPENSSKFDLFQKHRDELNEFATVVAETSIRFAYKSYAELWSEWIADGIFETHVRKLQARYSIKL